MKPPPGFRGVFRTDDDARDVYAEAAGIGRIVPRAVAVPSSAEDVALLLRAANEAGTPVIPRGSGSSMAGGAIGDGIILDVSRLRALEDPRPEATTLRAESGVVRGEVDRRAATIGMRFPVDPSSGAFCTIGGMASTNAAGPHSLRFGQMHAWVHALDCVFADGSAATIRRGGSLPEDIPAISVFARDLAPVLRSHRLTAPAVMKNSSGYGIAAFGRSGDLVDLLVGSEGTLAVFTAVEVSLVRRPAHEHTMLASFASLDDAVVAAIGARREGASACELLDGTFLRIAEQAGSPLPTAPGSDAALLVQAEGNSQDEVSAAIRLLEDTIKASGAISVVSSSGDTRDTDLWGIRHAASPAIARMDPSLRSMQFVEDCAVPPERLADYVRGVRGILASVGVRGVIFGHAGDAHVHVNPLLDVARPNWRDQAERILLDVTALVARLGGTLTGEHGDGRLRTPLLDRVWSTDALAQFESIKRVFDPRGILNPGVKVARPGQRAIDVVKYDPQAGDLTPRARRALDLVDRERAYSRFRLELL